MHWRLSFWLPKTATIYADFSGLVFQRLCETADDPGSSILIAYSELASHHIDLYICCKFFLVYFDPRRNLPVWPEIEIKFQDDATGQVLYSQVGYADGITS